MIDRALDGPPPATPVPPGAIDTQMHVYLPGFPAAHGAPPIPDGPAGIDEYRRVARRLGLSRVVITQGNAHGRDNANLLAALAAFGDAARGVAVITGETSDAEMRRLTDGGVTGARIMDLSGGAVGLHDLAAVDARAAAFGWCLAVQFDGARLIDEAERLTALRSNWILDHHGKFFDGITPSSPEMTVLKRLLDTGRCWFKFAACYESSHSGPPHYEDVGAIARAVAAHAPDRIVWGTNWPHVSIRRTEDYPDDAQLFDLAMSWLPDERTRNQVLVETPDALFFRR